MKLTKKAAALLLAASLAVSVCATPVFAAENMGSTSVDSTTVLGGVTTGNTKVLYKVTESYQWSIPATIDFGENAGVGKTSRVDANMEKDDTGIAASSDNNWSGFAPKIVVSKNVIGVGKKLQITVSTDYLDTSTDPNGKFYVQNPGTNEKLYFTIIRPAKGVIPETTLDKRDNEVLSVPSGTNTGHRELQFELETAPDNAEHTVAEKAGIYEGYVVFSSKIV
jgi:hypothetical protein